jgi:beta-RFAP synthase
MIRIRTAARLHFGLLALPHGEPPGASWPDRAGAGVVAGRWFGGVGMMVQDLGVVLTSAPAECWSATGPLADRALDFARRFERAMSFHAPRPQRLVIEKCSPEHAGLGTGTQLGLAVARALSLSWGIPGTSVVDLALAVGRGTRSAIGIHGFESGGFLVECGKRTHTEISPLLLRLPFPEEWRIVLIVPDGPVGRNGERELQAFEELSTENGSLRTTDALCRLVMLGMVPALAMRDFGAFGETIHDFNARAGELFASIQGGIYASPAVAEIVHEIRAWGVRGVGQSSWGPTVFALTEDSSRARSLAAHLQRRLGLSSQEVFITTACNQGASADCCDRNDR